MPGSSDLNTPLPQPQAFPAESVWEAYPRHAIQPPPYWDFTHARLGPELRALAGRHAGEVRLGSLGESLEGRELWTARAGRGGRRVLAFARQHGNEPICEIALLAALRFLLAEPEHPVCREILGRLDLFCVPLANPDGAQRFTRRTAYGIDLNRDARLANTPEGRLMLALREDFRPEVAFALHDMGQRKSTSTEGRLVALALLANPVDKQMSTNDVRLTAKRICVRMAEAAGRYAYGHIASYECPFMPRAYGDNMARWGAPTCLIEAGGWFGGAEGDGFVARLYFTALLAGLFAVATGSEAGANAAYYDTLPHDSGRAFFDLAIRSALIFDGAGNPPLRCDLAINCDMERRPAPAREEPRYFPKGSIADLGDLCEDSAKQEIAGEGLLAAPGLLAAAPDVNLRAPEDAARLAPFLSAGFTAVAAACGPFAPSEALEFKARWSEARAPVNLLLFERVDSLAAILGRHGQTPLCGFLARDLRLCARDLLAALPPPAAESAPPPPEGLRLRVDFFLRARGNPAANRALLVLRPLAASDTAPLADADGLADLRALFAAFFARRDQIAFCLDPLSRASDFAFLPAPACLCGVEGDAPPPDFLRRALEAQGASSEPDVARLLRRMTLDPAEALGLESLGAGGAVALRPEARGDWTLFALENNPDTPLARRIGAPQGVIVNGLLALREGAATPQGAGLALFP